MYKQKILSLYSLSRKMINQFLNLKRKPSNSKGKSSNLNKKKNQFIDIE